MLNCSFNKEKLCQQTYCTSMDPNSGNNMFTSSTAERKHRNSGCELQAPRGCQFKPTNTKLFAERSLEKMLSLYQMTYLYMPYVFTSFCVFALLPLKRNQTSQ